MSELNKPPEVIYLIPEEVRDGHCYKWVWCEDPAPGEGMDESDAIPYRRGSEWISVKDRLPEIEEMVLTYPYGPLPVRCVKESGEWFFDALIVTHWMPLPEPPTRTER